MPQRDDRDPVDRDILDIIPERFDADPDSRMARRGAHTRMILAIALALLAIAALGVAARHIFVGSPPPVQQAGDVPTIQPADQPVKSRPADPGGLDVPNKDKLVYERLGSNEAEPKSESLLPAPEQPQAPAPRQATIRPAFPEATAKSETAKPEEGTSGAVEATRTAPAEVPPPPSPPERVASAPAAPAPAVSHPAPAKKTATVSKPAAPVSSGGWVVQLAALKSQGEAQKEWVRVSGAHKDVLGGYSSDIVRADLGAKGVFWRVRAGPMDEVRARSVCAELAKHNQGCIVARK